jgi:hypothetical protein
MAEKKTQNDVDVWKLDAAAFNPKPSGAVTLLDGVEYPVYSFLDIPVLVSLEVLDIATRLSDMDPVTRMAESKRVIMVLNAGPEGAATAKISAEQLDRLALRQIVALTTLALSVSEVPLKAGEDEPKESASSSPAPAASTGGPTAA